MIRETRVSDAARIAEIDVTSSRFAYKNIIPDDCLYKDLSVEARIPVYERWINEKRFDLYVYEDPDTGLITGMMGIGMCEDEDKKDAFELHFLYVDPGYVRQGTGSQMLQFFEDKGKEKGLSEFVIWVLEENVMAINFYEKLGYHPDGKDKIFKRWNKREIRYLKSL
ncbi:MAG: GNAT family N-acetyltransferase [Clostridiales bacterium]|nr:GNAT family N-acetyltransferase [Clostridiales bacterium]